MIVSVRDVEARCAGCGEKQFTPLTPGALRPHSRLKCDGCGGETARLQELTSVDMKAADADGGLCGHAHTDSTGFRSLSSATPCACS